MSKKNKKNEPAVKTDNSHKQSRNTLFGKAETFLNNNHLKIFLILFTLFTIFALATFDVKISTDNDDALYVEAGYQYAALGSEYFYNANAPLYTMVLAVLILIFGYHLIILKIFSLLFMLTAFTLFYKSYLKRIPHLILFSVLIILAVNSSLMFFSSMTYTEAFYLMLQMSLFFLFFKFMENEGEEKKSFKKTWLSWLLLGLILTLLSLTKNVAVAAVPAIMVFFIIYKDFKSAGFTLGSFVVVRGIYEIIKHLIWGSTDQYATQTSILLQKHPYDASQGQESLAGFIGRLIDNTNNYLSRIIFQILGLRGENADLQPLLAVFILALFIFGIYYAFKKKHQVLLFTVIFTLSLEGLTFIVLQTFWGQSRMILIVVPFLLIVIFYTIYQWLMSRTALQPVYFIIVIILVITGLSKTIPKANSNIDVLSKNIKGDIYYGYTNDWVNYLKMSEWAGIHLPDSALIACRKAPMSFIYGKGKSFHGIYSVPSTDPDTIINRWKTAGVTHVIDASLRSNPQVADGIIISTVRRTIIPVIQKYPEKLKLVHQIGETEPAYLFEFHP
ncbi:MAG: hypothetical protein JXA06_07850 [Bacteroidetes bacterium]|nr:hypothetical protein [Bacteroidota bacterium]